MTDSTKNIIKHTIIVLAAAAAGLLLGYLVSSYEIRFMLAREYMGTYKNIEVYTCGDIDEENLKGHLSMLSYAPDELLKGCEKIYFTGSNIDIPMNEAGYDEALGLTQGSTVYVSTRNFGADVLLHELFHTYDSVCGTLSSNDPQFMVAFNEEKDNIRIIAGNSSMYSSEFFAEAGAMYIIAPNDLNFKAPKAFRFFNNIFGLYEVSDDLLF